MNKKRLLVIAVLALVGAWYAFRPERLFVQSRVNEEFPAAVAAEPMPESATTPTVLAAGLFHGVAHETEGTATVYQLPNGKRVLRLTNFHTSNGPDVQVYLVAAGDAKDNETVTQAGFVHVGPLKGSVGDQNYELPPTVDLARHMAVTVWCRRFGVNFGTAPLVPSRV